jgi:hypothetical protein
VEANRTDWDRKLHSALWAYLTSYKDKYLVDTIPDGVRLGSRHAIRVHRSELTDPVEILTQRGGIGASARGVVVAT